MTVSTRGGELIKPQVRILKCMSSGESRETSRDKNFVHVLKKLGNFQALYATKI